MTRRRPPLRRVRFYSGSIAAVALGVLLYACQTLPTQLPIANSKQVPLAAHSDAVVDATTMDYKLLFGYQGWFACPEDGSPLGAWEHWFRREKPAGTASVRVDMWPDVSELTPDERCRTPFTLPSGAPAEVYSAYNPKTVDRHFAWMKEYELPGVFLQRFTKGLTKPPVGGFRDAVARNVRAAAESHGRVFALMYDISGHPRETLVEEVKRDWIYVVDVLKLTESPRYLHHRGRPILAIWGFGFLDRSATPEQGAELIEFFKNHPEPRYRVTLMGGIPARWRTQTKDSQKDARWASVYRSFDVISPWSVGRFRDDRAIDRFYSNEVVKDLAETRRLGIDYMPVLFPGFSWHNMKPDAPFNRSPRRGGRFYWRQVDRALEQRATMLYGAMFDEVDEGTAMFKIAPTANEVPTEVQFVTLDVDGESIPSDWYLRLAREAQKALTRQQATTPTTPTQSAR